MFCSTCGVVNIPRFARRGSLTLEIILLGLATIGFVVYFALGLAFFIIFLIYAGWRLTTTYKICPSCSQTTLMSPDAPVAKRFHGGHDPS